MDSSANISIRAPKERNLILHIKGMNQATTEDELRKAIVRTLDPIIVPEIKISSLRPAFGGTQNATVFLPKEAATCLLRKKTILVGWIQCRVIERIVSARCPKCWRYDHLDGKCDGPNRANLCLNCAKSSHQAKTCTNDPFCPICNEPGHRVGNAICQCRKEANKNNARASH